MITTTYPRGVKLLIDGYTENPFVAWENLGAAATLGGTAVLTGGERANAVTGSTYDKWRPNVSGTVAALSFDFGTATAISFAAISAHNAETFGATVALQTSPDDSTWTTVSSAVAVAGVMAFRVTGSARYWRFYFTELTASDLLSVGVAFLGNELIIPRRLYQGVAPVLTPTEVQAQSNVSVGGHLLGSSIVSRGSKIGAAIKNVPAAFIRSADWLAFQTAFGEANGFFYAWRPTKYPQDIHYCWRDGGVIRPDNTGPLDLMSIKFEARVYDG
jgi:hypothetical protein